MKKIKFCLFSLIFLLAVAGIFPLTNNFTINALYSGEIINNVFFVTFKDGDATWFEEVPENYTSNIKTIMENSYNNSNTSVNEYYKTMSFNSLNLSSNLYFSGTSTPLAYSVPYTREELLTYSKTNPNGYLKYEVCTYNCSEEPEFLSVEYLMNTTYQFSCYNCGNSYHTGNFSTCDMDISDGIGCYCAYISFKNSNSKVALLPHLEEYVREQIALKTLLSQASSLSGNVDANGDGYIDALTFLFPHADGVDWSDLLWAHQSMLINIKDYIPQNYQMFLNPQFLLLTMQSHGVRNETVDTASLLTTDIKLNNKVCLDYNLYLFSDLVYEGQSALKGDDNKEIAKVFTLAHELGHILGLPDYYTYISEQSEEDPVNVWDLMSYSYYSAPTYLTTYSREILGFTNSNNVKTLTKSGTYTLKPTCYDEMNNNNNNSNNVLAYVLEDPNFENQKIYIEYRYKGGKFEPNYPSKQDGLIIYRVDNNVNPVPGYGGMLSSGNFGSYPFNMYVFRTRYSTVFNNNYNTFGNENTNLTSNAITFQTYDTSKTQDDLTYDDITFINSGIVIENISINTQTNEISFKISGGYLTEPEVDLSSVTLNGSSSVTLEVFSNYTDAGVNFGNFIESDFVIDIVDEVNTNIVGSYYYTYLITHIETGEFIELTRTINIKDTQAPTVTLIGAALVEIESLNNYIEQGVEYFDNYNNISDLQCEISQPEYNELKDLYEVYYVVTDTSGNSTTIIREIKILSLDFSSVELLGNTNVIHEVNTPYTDSGINFGIFNENQFYIEVNTDLNVNLLGDYFYAYNFTYISTAYKFSLNRTISVVDRTDPVIELNGEDYIEIYRSQVSTFTDPGFTVSDNYDTYLHVSTTRIDLSSTKYKITYFTEDSSGNSTTVERIIEIVDKPINIVDNQISVLINNSYNTEFTANSVITIKVDFVISDDNNANPQVSFYVNNNQITTTNNNSVTVKLTNAGIYNIKVIVGEAEITKQIIVNDILAPKVNNTTLIVIIIIVALILIFTISIISVKNKAKKIKSRLDKY